MANDCPIVLVHGLFGWGPSEMGGFPYWGTGHSVPSTLTRFEATVGPISSTHDRACELAYQIKGGQVDYGASHASEAGHARYGKTYEPSVAFHPDWSEQHPVHLVGHSMGGPTIVLLQQLLAEDFFGWGSTHRWAASLSSISGVLNGSTATYFYGCDETTGLLDQDGAAAFLMHAIEVSVRATGGVFDGFYDFGLEQWGLGTQANECLDGYVQRIAGSAMFVGKDNGAYSLTVQSLLDQTARCLTYPDTYYFSYATEQTAKGFLSDNYYPEPDMNPSMIPSAMYIGSKRFARPFYPGFRSADWWPNDGLVSVYSQVYPRIAGRHPTGGGIDGTAGFDPGAWYYQILDGFDHIDIVAVPQLNQIGQQKRFYMALYERLASLTLD